MVLIVTVAVICGAGYLLLNKEGRALSKENGAGSMKSYRISGLSMAPDFSDGEMVKIDENVYQKSVPNRGDVIAFKFEYALEARVKRVAAIPGDQLSFEADKLLINRQSVGTAAYNPKVWPPGETITVPADMYFVLSANLAGGEDSRQWGYVERRAILGRVRP